MISTAPLRLRRDRSSWATGNIEVNGQAQTQTLIGDATQSVEGQRRNSYSIHPPALTPGQRTTFQPTDSFFVPGVITYTPHVPSPPRKERSKVLFYEEREPYYGFTNFSSHPVKYEGREYPTSEHLFQSFKFTHQPTLAEHIRTCSDRPSIAFSEALRFTPEVRSDWNTICIRSMDTALYHKFTQHKDLRRELLGTGNAKLVHNSDKDAFWGRGADGKGRNELGKALERLRAQLRREKR